VGSSCTRHLILDAIVKTCLILDAIVKTCPFFNLHARGEEFGSRVIFVNAHKACFGFFHQNSVGCADFEEFFAGTEPNDVQGSSVFDWTGKLPIPSFRTCLAYRIWRRCLQNTG
jgi:hypothetical protein